jgi:hypothetical protein
MKNSLENQIRQALKKVELDDMYSCDAYGAIVELTFKWEECNFHERNEEDVEKVRKIKENTYASLKVQGFDVVWDKIPNHVMRIKGVKKYIWEKEY